MPQEDIDQIISIPVRCDWNNLPFLPRFLEFYFNSSKVRLELGLCKDYDLSEWDFNSSKVRLELFLPQQLLCGELYFNSSKVRLEHEIKTALMKIINISIPVRCDWNGNRPLRSFRFTDFNSSKVRLEPFLS